MKKIVGRAIKYIYVGQTGRSFEARMSDHERSFIYNDRKSNYSKHILNKNRIFNDDFNILHIATKDAKLNALESLEINKLKNEYK